MYNLAHVFCDYNTYTTLAKLWNFFSMYSKL